MMRTFFRYALHAPLLLLVLAVPATAATTYYVSPNGSDTNPGTSVKPFKTIQQGITHAGNGDTVTLQDGTYAGSGDVDLDFGGYNITLNSVNGASKAIINCGGSSSVNHHAFDVQSGETNAVVSGLTIENGYEAQSGGSAGIGGAIYVYESTLTVEDCILQGNEADSAGGSIYNDGGTLNLFGCDVEGSTASHGGGVYENGGKLNIVGCAIYDNSAGDSGGGIYNSSGTATLNACYLTNNAANAGGGGGIEADGTSGLVNCVVAGNTSYKGGAAIEDFVGATINVINCTIAYNSSNIGIGGISNYNSEGAISLINAILYDDGGETDASGFAASHCDIEGGLSGTANIDADPQFLNVSNGDLHLMPNSPCIGAGTHTDAAETDIDGTLRANPPAIGAYEGPAPTVPPVISSLSPSSATAGGPAFSLTVTGTNFGPNSLVNFGSATLSTAYVNGAKLTASVPASLIAAAGTRKVTVTTPNIGTSSSKTFTVNASPITLSSLTLTPTSVTAGQTSLGKITLSAAAPAGGATITLKSSDTSSATVPSSITIAAGNKSISFEVTGKSVTSSKTVTITATVGSSTKTATLTVTPATVAVTVQALSVSPTSVTGGTSSTGTVTLTGAAPSGGLAVSLKSSDTSSATVAGTLNIAAGATSAKFKVTTYAVTANKTVTLTATVGSTSKTTTLTVNAPPLTVKSLSLSPSTVTGGQATTGTITLTGNAPSSGAAVAVTFSGGGGGTVTVPAGASTAMFSILTFKVTTKQTVTVSAAYGGTTKTATLTVNPSSGSAPTPMRHTDGPVFVLPRL